MSSSAAQKGGKKFTLKTVLDGLRGSGSSSQSRPETEIEETLRSEHYHVTKTVRHGFPFTPTALAFDPIQHLLAIGNRNGSLRIIGQPGVDCHCSHESEVSIVQILFLINEGALVTVTSDDQLHLWNFRQKRPTIVHSLKFQREKISKCHLPFQSKWLYVGTERGNVHVVNIESFTCSGYIINWNKAIELSRKTHPGHVVHLSDNPVDANKLLIGFETGAIVFWDLRTKSAEYRYNSHEALRSISWHNEGKQFMCSHTDGSLSTWNVKMPQRPVSVTSPHAKIGPEGKPDLCKPINKVEWRANRSGDSVVIFSGGMSYDRACRTPTITVMAGKSTTVLEMEHNIVDFVSICDTPWVNDFQDPYAIIVLLLNDLVVIDLTTPGYPCFENPYPMDLHESPVTACQYYANCPMDIIPALYSTGKNQKKTGFSDKPWPIKGGSWGSSGTSYPEIIITGHADGSLKFWDASSVTLQFLYKLKTAKVFEKPKRPSEDKDDDPFAIQNIFLCLESRIMCVAGPTHCILFKFSKQEANVETVALEFSIVYEVFDELDSPDFDFSKPSLSVMGQHSSSMGSYSSTASENARSEAITSVKAKTGNHRWGPGFLPELVCILCWVDGEPAGNITVMSLNSSYGLLAFGNESGLAIVDYLQKTCLLNLGTPDLYGSMDPYQRAPRSPRSKRITGEVLVQASDDCKSPTVDQLGSHLGLPPNSACGGTLSSSMALLSNNAPAVKLSDSPDGAVIISTFRNHPAITKSKSLAPNANVLTTQQSSQQTMHITVTRALSLGSTETAPFSLPLNNNQNIVSSDKSFRTEPATLEGPKPPPRNKKKKQQPILVHQPALDLPPSPNKEVGFTTSSDSSHNPLSPSALMPVICLSRSASETGEKGLKPQLVETLEAFKEPYLLCPVVQKSISTGDIPCVQYRRNSTSSSDSLRKEAAAKTMSDPKSFNELSVRETESKEILRKSSSDSHLSLNESTQVLHYSHHIPGTHNRNWLLKKIHGKSKKTKKVEGEEKEAKSRNISCSNEIFINDSGSSITASNLEDNSKLADNYSVEAFFKDVNDVDNTDCGVKSPASSKNIFSRVSLKIKSLGSRKSSEEEEKELGPTHPVYRFYQKSQEKLQKFKINVLDLTDDLARKHNMRKMYLSDVMQSRKAVDKNDGSSFSRSRSSSMSSLDNVTKEAIQCLVFADSYTRKQDNETSPCLWVGTSLGSVIVIVLVLQPDQRHSQPVIVSPSGSLYRMKGAIVCMSFLDFKGGLIPAVSEQWRDNRDNRDITERISNKATSRQMSVSNSKPKISPTSSTEINNDRQFAIICSEKQARAISLPSQTCAFKVKVTETSFVVRAEVVAMRESVCLMCYVANGHIVAFSLPSLKPLFDADFLPLTDYRVARTFCFSNNGHAMFLCSPSEIQKITYSSEITENLNEMLGELYLHKETPEPPKQGFLKTLFGGGVTTLDREELFGEASGKASKGLAKHIPGSGNLHQLAHQAGASSSEFTRTRMLLSERGEKLGDLEDRSAQMMNSAEQFASAAHNVMLKCKDKKWYQF
ncbi:syntaxin-binding protein 5-like isoform X1 [Biomphalaria glabrata]|uniref:Syntaxin-binding protein 5-like isoform X1 n=1 Tax=Biomphalaria glabrata TaxID=6526 RepID=A0A9W3AN33_BIOGL|nr:syntaxin-binding protein 5-like isoform X1 [Biomphalaria glabrata]